jgi:hypothetical protein
MKAAKPPQPGKNRSSQKTKIQRAAPEKIVVDKTRAGKAKASVATTGNTKAKIPETKPGQSNARVRRHYENTAN